MIELIPGILEKDWTEIEKKIEIVKPFAQWIHLDIIDGKFADNTTFLDPAPFSKYTDSISFEVHLMVDEPEQYLESFAKAGFKRFIGHVEKMSDQVSFIARGELLGEVGLALDGPTPISAIKVPYDDLDFLTLMTIKAGFSGQAFQKEQLQKGVEIRTSSDVLLEIDGGVNEETAIRAVKSGVTRFVATSTLFGDNPRNQFTSLLTSIEKNQIF